MRAEKPELVTWTADQLAVLLTGTAASNGLTTTMNSYRHVTPTMQKNAVDQFASRLAGT